MPNPNIRIQWSCGCVFEWNDQRRHFEPCYVLHILNPDGEQAILRSCEKLTQVLDAVAK